MKSKYLYIVLLLSCASICFAQDKLFDKYADMDGVTSVYISKKMFQMIPLTNTAGLNLANLKGKIESLQILSTEKNAIQEKARKEFTQLISSQHEELMRVKDGNTKANFYIKQKGEIISELIMLADTGNNGFTVIKLLGNFTLKEIQQITEEVTIKK